MPPREPPLEPRPAGTVPECVPPWLATRTRRGQSSRRERVARRRRMRRGGCGYEAPLRRSEVGRRPSRVRSDMPHAPRKRGWQAPLARPARDATPPSYLYSTNEKVKRSYRPGGQGRRAGGRGLSQLPPPSPSYCALLVPLSIYSVGGGTLGTESRQLRHAARAFLRSWNTYEYPKRNTIRNRQLRTLTHKR